VHFHISACAAAVVPARKNASQIFIAFPVFEHAVFKR